MTTLAVSPPEASVSRRERPASVPEATPEDLAQCQRILEATGCRASVVTGALGGWDLLARDGLTITLVAVSRGTARPDLHGPQYLGRDGWPPNTKGYLFLCGADGWPQPIPLF